REKHGLNFFNISKNFVSIGASLILILSLWILFGIFQRLVENFSLSSIVILREKPVVARYVKNRIKKFRA
ncbi:hypothetical protein KKC52_12510, partial [bacterium]|nr:hypothetical protein [bacterium]